MSRQNIFRLAGTDVRGASDWNEALELAGLNWEVRKLQTSMPIEQTDGRILYFPTEAHVIVRQDKIDTGQYDSAVLGRVGPDYQPVQNVDQFGVMELLTSTDHAELANIGSFGGGSKIFAQAKVSQIEIVPGDVHETLLTGINSHDGTSNCLFFLTSVRICCQNSYMRALRTETFKLKVRHDRNADTRIETIKADAEAQRALKTFNAGAEEIQELLRTLANRQITKEAYEKFIEEIFPTKEAKIRETSSVEDARVVFTQLFLDNDKGAFPQIRGSAYNLFNATTEFFDHVARTRNNGEGAEYTRAKSAMIGVNFMKKNAAIARIVKLAESAPIHTLTSPRVYSMPSDMVPALN